LRRKLVRRGHPGSAVDQELDRLVGERLLDDSRFTEAYATWRESRGFGPVRIRAELGQRGVEGATVERILDELDIDWAASALAARRKKFGTSAIRDLRERAKQTRHLEYRGFTREQIRHALDSDE
jgi:regulatory protein